MFEKGIKWHSTITIALSIIAIVLSSYCIKKNYGSPKFVTINIQKIIDNQASKVDKEMLETKQLPSTEKLQRDIEKYTEHVAEVLKGYTANKNMIVFEKSSIISSGIYIEDITDDFLKAISE